MWRPPRRFSICLAEDYCGSWFMSLPATSSRYAALRQNAAQKFRAGWAIFGMASTRGGVWLLSVMATIAAPCLPLFIELLKSGSVRSDSIYITAAVISAAFSVSAQHVMFRALYIALFVVNLIFDMVAGSGPFKEQLDSWAVGLLVLVAVLHTTERAWWHLVMNRPFPEST